MSDGSGYRQVLCANSFKSLAKRSMHTVGLNVPIQSNSIVADWFYSVAGRGNTNHYDYDGVANVTLHGNMYINAE